RLAPVLAGRPRFVRAARDLHDGRRMNRPSSPPARTVAEALARAAHLDRLSVQAFLELAWDLEGLGAPPSYVRRAIQAAADEVRHAKTMTTLARVRGAVVCDERTAPAGRQELRHDLFEVAIRN